MPLGQPSGHAFLQQASVVPAQLVVFYRCLCLGVAARQACGLHRPSAGASGQVCDVACCDFPHACVIHRCPAAMEGYSIFLPHLCHRALGVVDCGKKTAQVVSRQGI